MVSAQLGGHVSSSTLSAHQMPHAGDASHSDSLEWVQFFDMGGLYFWNRRTRETARQPPAGVTVVACQYICPSSSSWVAGYGVSCLASPHPFWVPILLLAARVVLASAVFFLVLLVEGDMEVVGFFWLLERAWCRRVRVCSSWLRHGERLDSSGCCVANGCF